MLSRRPPSTHPPTHNTHVALLHCIQSLRAYFPLCSSTHDTRSAGTRRSGAVTTWRRRASSRAPSGWPSTWGWHGRWRGRRCSTSRCVVVVGSACVLGGVLPAQSGACVLVGGFVLGLGGVSPVAALPDRGLHGVQLRPGRITRGVCCVVALLPLAPTPPAPRRRPADDLALCPHPPRHLVTIATP